MSKVGGLALILCITALLFLGSCVRQYGSVIPAKETPEAAYALFERKCSSCHDLRRVHLAHDSVTGVQMIEIIKVMQAKPASEITEDQIEAIHDSMGSKRVRPGN